MKKLICILLAIAIAACFAACDAPTPSTDPTSNNGTTGNNNKEPGFTFTHNGTKITMHAEAAPIVTALGEPKSYTEETSCAFTGLDKTYYYGGFYMQTYPNGDKDYVYSVWFADDSVTTEEGVYVGMVQADVEKIYGAENYNGTNAYILTKGACKLTVILKDGVVTSVQYVAVID